jgi:hypothetical protein
VGRSGFAIILDMRLGRLGRVVRRMFVMSSRQLGVVRRRFVPSCFVMLRSFLVVSSRIFVMLCRPLMMFRSLF